MHADTDELFILSDLSAAADQMTRRRRRNGGQLCSRWPAEAIITVQEGNPTSQLNRNLIPSFGHEKNVVRRF